MKNTARIAQIFDLPEAAFAAAEFEKLLIVENSQLSSKSVFDQTLLSCLLADQVDVLLDSNRTDVFLRMVHEQQPVDVDKYSRKYYGKHGLEFRSLDTQKLWSLYDDGCTIMINRLESLVRSARDFCSMLEEASGCRVQINLYHSNGATYGFSPHIDYHDVFIIQLRGKKKWSFCDKLENTATIRTPEEPYSVPNKWDQTHILNEGHIAYIPCGTWHAVEGIGIPTTHLTVSLRYTTILDYLSWLGKIGNASSILRSRLYRSNESSDDADSALLDAIRLGVKELKRGGIYTEKFFEDFSRVDRNTR